VTVTVARATSRADVELAYWVRHDVFVLEQDVPLDLERDEHDEDADHFLARVCGEAAGAGRLVVEHDGAGHAVGHLGRLAVLPAYRGSGVGVALVGAIETRAAARELAAVILGAQVHALGFYERLGYSAHGEEFDDAGIPHRHMRKELGST
jgi:predicted GNAT family N-acyltransferase